ncbi:MAG TPA: hypothetical protein VNF69_02180 [Burkholderiales bacterium]|nr:hypothetical protein [Burkholderiales bacterium]
MTAATIALLLSACASYSGSGLVPGTSSAADVEALMGTPSLRLPQPGGGSVWFYSRLPDGRDTYKVTIAPDGAMRSIEQVLTKANVARIHPDVTTMAQVRALLGPPGTVSGLTLKPRIVWEYKMRDVAEPRILWVQFSKDDIVREVIEMHDFSADPQGEARACR